MTESELYLKELKPLFNRLGCFMYRFEHKRIPDLYISRNGKVLWAELKTINRPQKIIKPDWRPGQLAWIKEHNKLGGKNICLILNYCDVTYFLPPKQQYKLEELKCQKNIYLNQLRK